MTCHVAKGWYIRGGLPHFDAGGVAQSVTFRLVDSLPAEFQSRLRQEDRLWPAADRPAEVSRRIDRYLDSGCGAAWLRDPQIAGLVQAALLHHDGSRYELHAWVVMPNHVHMLLTPSPETALSRIVNSLKSFTARQANAYLGRQGAFWQRDYYDRFIRNDQHFAAALSYIENNPVAAGLCDRAAAWPWSSASYCGRLARDA